VILILFFIAINLLSFRRVDSGHRYTSVGFTEWFRFNQSFIAPTKMTVAYPRLAAEILVALAVTSLWAFLKRRK